MDRFQPIDVSNSSLGAHLFPSEEVYLLTPGVGLYSGASKSLPHSSGTVYLTSHRLFYIDDAEPHRHSCFLKLSIVRETQYYAGFLKSSPKITIGLKKELDASRVENGNEPASLVVVPDKVQDWRLTARPADASASALPTRSWVCRVCAFSNALDPGASQDSTVKCSLCGVTSDVKDLSLSQHQQPPSKAKVSSAEVTTKSSPTTAGLACPVCTFQNHPSMLRCEICDSPLVTAHVDDAAAPSPRASPSKTPEPVAETDPARRTELPDHVRLSFRRGGDKSFYETLKKTVKAKRWHRGEQQTSTHGTNGTSGTSTPTRRRYQGGALANIDGRSARAVSDEEWEADPSTNTSRSRGVGIEGILSAVDLQSRVEKDDMQDALRDLEALMTRAKKMVDLAESLNAKLIKSEATRQGDGTSGEEQEAANTIRSSMLRLGLPTPAITSDMARDELEYNVQLARELGGLLYAAQRPLIGRGKVLSAPSAAQSVCDDAEREGCGILPLDEVWCLWNRARGVALVSPKVLLNVLPLLSRLTVPSIACKTLSSGLKVIHTPRYAAGNLSARICALLDAKAAEQRSYDQTSSPSTTTMTYTVAGITTLELAAIEACPVSLMAELLNDVEADLGVLVQDVHAGHVTWYRNIFDMT
jgi:ESCRT-II complex subunit VPS36